MTLYYEVKISAETAQQANEILNSLLRKKLVTGGQIINSPARFLWKGKITDMDYYSIMSYTLGENKKHIIDDVKINSSEEVPMISFQRIEGNSELLSWIDETLSK